jgi:hypothetical protein
MDGMKTARDRAIEALDDIGMTQPMECVIAIDRVTKAIDAAVLEERERCASLHESVNPASDEERSHGDPGAGAMGAVIEYRDLIRRGVQ